MKISDPLIAELAESIVKLEKIVEEREELGDLYDAAEDRCYEDWRQRQDDEREERLEAALTAALEAGVDREHLKVLAFETGAVSWALKQSLKLPEPKREKSWFKDDSRE